MIKKCLFFITYLLGTAVLSLWGVMEITNNILECAATVYFMGFLFGYVFMAWDFWCHKENDVYTFCRSTSQHGLSDCFFRKSLFHSLGNGEDSNHHNGDNGFCSAQQKTNKNSLKQPRPKGAAKL